MLEGPIEMGRTSDLTYVSAASAANGNDFLFEIGLEEVPARMIAGAEAELLRRSLAMLGKESLLGDGFDPLTDAKSYSTPRRLAVLVKNVKAHQADITEEVTGPATKIAFKDGVPTPAAEAFARKSGVSVGELRRIRNTEGRVSRSDFSEEGPQRCRSHRERAAERNCSDLLGQEYVLARRQAGAVCASGAVDGLPARRLRCSCSLWRQDGRPRKPWASRAVQWRSV